MSVVSKSSLFRHITGERAEVYRAILELFASAKRQFRLHLRPDEVRLEAAWANGEAPAPETVQLALSQLAEWGNLIAQPDTARVSSLEDFYRARFLYRLSAEGEAVESAMAAFTSALKRRAELQSVALDDIASRLLALRELGSIEPLDAAKVHEAMRDLFHVFVSLAENAQAFMAQVARSVELHRAEAHALMEYKGRLIEYLERFIGDLVVRSSEIATLLDRLAPKRDALLATVARREARDAAPEGDQDEGDVLTDKLAAWRERWAGLVSWFTSSDGRSSQSELLRSRARSAIPQLLAAIAALNERRSGKSDRSSDYRVLARWFADCRSDDEAHRLYRAAFALHPARHLALRCPKDEVPASTPWARAPAAPIHPRLRERGTLTRRGAPPKVRDRTEERRLLAAYLATEQAQLEAARAKIVRGEPILLSELGPLDRHEFRLLLGLIGEALAAQTNHDASVERQSGDGLLRIRLEPLGPDTHAELQTELGVFAGRDHRLTIHALHEGST